MPKDAIFKKECKKVLFNSFVMMQSFKLGQLFFLAKKLTFFVKKILCLVLFTWNFSETFVTNDFANLGPF